MSFLQPAMLLALPVIALPIIIHLINQRRYRTIDWAAMKFLLAANTMSRGYARIRQWLILALRTLALAGLIFAISRPLTSGWLKVVAPGNIDTTLILIDRSPSMQEQVARSGLTKLELARQQLINSLSLLHSNRWVVIDSVNQTPLEIESPEKLDQMLETQKVSASANFPEMLQAAYQYIKTNRPSRTEIWICSDLRLNDWNPDSARWQILREAFLESPVPVHFHLLSYLESQPENRALRVLSAHTRPTDLGQELLLTIQVRQPVAPLITEQVRVPVRLELNGSVQEVPMDLMNGVAELKNYSVPLEPDQTRGWGKVSLPADANAADNEYYFVFDNPPARKTLIVAEQDSEIRPLQLAASISPASSIQTDVEVISLEQVPAVAWDQFALLLWQAPLPTGEQAGAVHQFLNRGGNAIFFPPQTADNTELAGLSWQNWEESLTPVSITRWREDQDLFENVGSGALLPLGELAISRYQRLQGEYTPLATLSTGDPFLVRALTDHNNLYFCTTRPHTADSTLARQGIVLYAMIQRALAAGATSLSTAQQWNAGTINTSSTANWTPLATTANALSLEYAVQAGVYQSENRLLAINRSAVEDRGEALTDERLASLFAELNFDHINQQIGQGSSLLREVWPAFLLGMMLALVAESVLCLPRTTSVQEKLSPFKPGGLA